MCVGLVYEAFTPNFVVGHAMYFGLHCVTRRALVSFSLYHDSHISSFA